MRLQHEIQRVNTLMGEGVGDSVDHPSAVATEQGAKEMRRLQSIEEQIENSVMHVAWLYVKLRFL